MSADFDDSDSSNSQDFEPSEIPDPLESGEGWWVEDNYSEGVDGSESEPVFEPEAWAPPSTAPLSGAVSDHVAPIPNTAPSSAGRGRQFVVGIVVGALIGGAVGGGVAALVSRGDTQIITQPNPVVTEVRNTSRLAIAQDVQGIVARVEPAVVAIRTGAAVDDGLFTGRGPS
ncbi:MAG: hypothetical protein JHC94_06750, partial [Acidimicrobiia bacterium]|nr:hypothetical protein [Acidimicrobiia bacterium]